MKHLYTILAAAVVAFAANADITKTIKPKADVAKTETSTGMKFGKVSKIHDAHRFSTRASRAAITAADVEGDYTFTAMSYLDDDPAMSAKIQIIAIDDENIQIRGMVDWPVVASVAADGTISIARQQIGEAYGYEMYATHYQWTDDYSDVFESEAPLEGFYIEGYILFEEDDICCVEACTNGVFKGYWELFDTIEMAPIAPEIPEEPEDPTAWEDYGTADMIDGWIISGMGVDQFDYPVKDIKLQRNTQEDGVYRLVNPYKCETYADINITKVEEGYIKVNIANPEYPFVYPGIKAGFGDEYGEYYCYDDNGYYYLVAGYDIETIIDVLGAYGGLSTYDPETATMTIPSACFGDSDNPNGGYYWVDEDDEPLDMSAAIIFHFPGEPNGIENVSVDNTRAVYYNLQGIRVAEPTTGIYIRRIGNTTTKVNVIR